MWDWIADKLLAPAIVAVIFSWATSFLLESHRARRDLLTKQVEGVRSDLEVYWKISSEYWCSPVTSDDAVSVEQILMKEADLRFSAMDISYRLRTLPPDKMRLLLADLGDASTGGAFGEPDRAADLQRVSRLRLAVVVFRDALLTARNESLKSPFRIGH